MTLFEKLLTTKELMKELKIEGMCFRTGDFIGRQWFSIAKRYSLGADRVVYYLYCRERYRENVTYMGEFAMGMDDIYIDDDNMIIVLRKNESCNVLLLSKSCMMDEIPEGFFHQDRRQQSFKLDTFNCLYKDYMLSNFE